MNVDLRRVVPAVIVAVALLGVLWWAGPGTTPVAPAPVDRAGPEAPAPVREARSPVRATPPPAPEQPEVAPGPGSAVVAHQRIAEALGGVSIRCYVGTQLDGTALWGGRYQPRIEDGWFSDVVRTLEGERQVMQSPEVEGDNEAKPLFEVRWKAEEAPSSVPCEVHWPDYAELVVRAIDAEGAPVEGVQVSGCSLNGRTDAEGVLRRTVAVAESCLVMGNVPPWAHEGGPLPRDQRVVAGLTQGEVREVELLMVPPTEEDPMEEPPAPPPVDWAIDPTADGETIAERAERVRALLQGADGAEADVIREVAESLEVEAMMRRRSAFPEGLP